MIRWHRLMAMSWARSIEFLRDRSALAWNLLFPMVTVIGFAVIFSGPTPPMFKVAVLGEAVPDVEQHPLLETPQVQFYAEADPTQALHKLERHRIDLLVDLQAQPPRYWVNELSPKGVVLEQLFAGAGGTPLQREPVKGDPIRYVDWVVPGLLGMNMMFSCLFGLGYVVVRYRKSGYLKRLNATPLTALEFVTAQLISRLMLILGITAGMFLVMDQVLDFRVDGSLWLLLLVALAGAMAMTAMGLVVAARVASEELAGGLLNLVSWPMMLLSGVFYSLDGAPEAVQWLAQIFPLTHMLDAARAVMLDGAGVAGIGHHLLVLAAMAVGFLLIGAAGFRWTQD